MLVAGVELLDVIMSVCFPEDTCSLDAGIHFCDCLFIFCHPVVVLSITIVALFLL